jgi:hypothetical protein
MFDNDFSPRKKVEFGEATDPTLVPDQTDTYTPLSNLEVIGEVRKQAGNMGYDITTERYLMNKKRSQFFGTFVLGNEDGGISSQIGICNSYDKTRSAIVAVGASVHRCFNLSFSTFKEFRKHTGEIGDDFENMVENAMGLVEDETDRIRDRYDLLKQVDLNNDNTSFLLGKLLYDLQLPVTLVNATKKSLLDDDYVFGDNTWFDFHMHVTQALKESHPRNLVEDHIATEEFMVGQARDAMGMEQVASRQDQGHFSMN